jgi:hypothetical protein
MAGDREKDRIERKTGIEKGCEIDRDEVIKKS